ncbi:MAG: MMPL family transporter, partial [Halobacteriaceae archaeon]
VGTGGALLGSAATTVGGFGVLAFAILPPLQQFGIITGITIIYAFGASVFLLPSLLILWLRFVNPSKLEENAKSSTRYPGGIEFDDLEGIEGERNVWPPSPKAGEEYQATLNIPSVTGRVVLRASVPGEITKLNGEPEPIISLVVDDTCYVAWDVSEKNELSISYTGAVSDETSSFESTIVIASSIDR